VLVTPNTAAVACSMLTAYTLHCTVPHSSGTSASSSSSGKKGASSSKKAGEVSFSSRKGPVYLHPMAANFNETVLDSRYAVYHEVLPLPYSLLVYTVRFKPCSLYSNAICSGCCGMHTTCTCFDTILSAVHTASCICNAI
jgi:hypothetical protein